ncbi:Gfo/Idh/MocA family protein [Mycetocola miduiensis]|uniref:Predicted dehydrogenase n=1 Tax=Mycetocola miduiensis TaxID=995034 RepID=A0A1I5C3S5_9MICO|nr:Gfo/Idh/MocA family oxidoreductase [Mycetocola miduiensis]SFN81673.1 Predicted dehydrogenase [Mycetocola miduiensis]
MTGIRTAIIGFGTSGRVFHGPLLAANPEFSVDLVVTSDPERKDAASSQHQEARIVDTADGLFDRSDELDLVVIGSPPNTHADIAMRAIDAGLAVVVDKPFTATSAEGRAVIDQATAKNVPLTVFQNRRWDADFLTLRELLEQGALGEVHRFESRFEWWKPTPSKAWKATTTADEGGGILFDLGTHLLDQALQLFGAVEEISAELDVRNPHNVADDDAFVALRHSSGVRTHLWMSSVSAQSGPRFRVLGSQSGYTKWGLDLQEEALLRGASPADPDYGVEPPTAWGKLGVGESTAGVPARRGSYDDFYALLADALLRGASLPVDPRDSLEVIELIEHIHSVAASGSSLLSPARTS